MQNEIRHGKQIIRLTQDDEKFRTEIFVIDGGNEKKILEIETDNESVSYKSENSNEVNYSLLES